VLTITFAFLLSDGQGGHRAVASFARDLTPTQRAAVRCWFNLKTRTNDVPTENCIYRVLKAVPVLEFQQALWLRQHARHGAQDGSVVVLDGKALRGSQGTQLVGAINARSGRTLGIEAVRDKSNEIPAAQTLLGRLELDGAIALMDALHTQVRTAHSIVQEGGRGLCPLYQRQPSRTPGPSATLPAGRFFPLNCSRLRKATAALSGAASKSSPSPRSKWGFRMSCNWRAWIESANSAPDARRWKAFG